MQTTHTTAVDDFHGSFKHARTLSVRRRPGMSGAYVRHRINPVNHAPVRREDTGWRYHNNYAALARWARKHQKDLFEVLYPDDPH
jgi:hypothetical protein